MDLLCGYARWGKRAFVANRLTGIRRSEEHTSELQSQSNLVCRLLLEKKQSHRTINADLVAGPPLSRWRVYRTRRDQQSNHGVERFKPDVAPSPLSRGRSAAAIGVTVH